MKEATQGSASQGAGMKYLYLALGALGIALTYSQFIPFFLETPDLGFFFSQAFANRAAAGVAFDLLITAAAALLFMYSERKSIGKGKLAIVFASVFVVGVCLALPLFLYFREESKEGPKAKK